jgi:hypothetical protein
MVMATLPVTFAVVPGVHVAGSTDTELMPPPLLLKAGQAAKLAETLCDAPVMVTVAVHVCGPVPSGGGVPFSFTVNCHCVPLGEMTLQPPPAELQKRFIVKLPFASALAFCCPPICTGIPLTMMVAPELVGGMPTSAAETFAKLYGTPFVSLTVPLTSVGVWPRTESAHMKKIPAIRSSFLMAF